VRQLLGSLLIQRKINKVRMLLRLTRILLFQLSVN